ncbi:DNA-directed RNA polymerase beta subunit [Candidatus Vidania fulgoroideae]|nr:DNA-directed RNA polymerase beta subunit [Candidatus Vidania fulgoroideae]
MLLNFSNVNINYSDFYKKNGDFYIESYKNFILKFEKRIKRFFPIFSVDKKTVLNLNNISFLRTKEKSDFCKINNSTYFLSIRGTFIISSRLEKKVNHSIIKVNIVNVPCITKNSSFIINGLERTVISYLKKSPGIFFFSKDLSKKARLIPKIGTWIDLIMDVNKIIKVKINKGKSLNIFTLLNSFSEGRVFLKDNGFFLKGKIVSNKIYYRVHIEDFKKKDVFNFNIIDESKNTLFKKGESINKDSLQKLKKKYILYPFKKKNIKLFKKIKIKGKNFNSIEALNNKKNKKEIYKKEVKFYFINEEYNEINNFLLSSFLKYKENSVKRNKILTVDSFNNSYNYTNDYKIKNFKKFFLSRRKIKFSNKTKTVLKKFGGGGEVLDFNNVKAFILFFLYRIKKNKSNDLDNIVNKRIFCVGDILWEIIEKKIVFVLNRIKKKIGSAKNNEYKKIINFNLLNLSIREFFCSSQFSQFLDQNNDLSEFTHKRRINVSSISFYNNSESSISLRNIHISSFGKICPIETPEGVNIGLVNSFAAFSKVNSKGNIVSPYLKIKNNKIDFSKVYFLDSEKEKDCFITSIENFKKNGTFLKKMVFCRHLYNIVFVKNSLVNYCDFSPLQLFSVAPLLVPFMESNDANRVLMGSNMQRQSVVCIKPRSPYVGTGFEFIPPFSLNYIKTINKNSKIVYKEGNFLITKYLFKGKNFFKTIFFKKFGLTNQGNILRENFSKEKNIIKEGKNTHNGKLSLGQNVLAAFLPFYGYNFEDSIIVSERLVKKEIFCSLHIQNFFINLTNEKGSKDIINKDIFLIEKRNYKKLDKEGIIKVGSFVDNNDVLVSKVKKIGDSIEPELKFINTVINRSNDNYKENFFRLPKNVFGTVVEVTRINKKKNGLREEVMLEKQRGIEKTIDFIFEDFINNMVRKFKLDEKKFVIKANVISYNGKKNKKIINRITLVNNIIYKKKKKNEEENSYILNPVEKKGAYEIIKIKLITKKNLEVGDKMSGRHGNKGVVSKILPVEDMPFLSDGTSCDLILNPLGVPSRMNVGQVFEMNLGFFIFLLNRIRTENKDKFKKILEKIKGKFKQLKILNKHKKIYIETPSFTGLKSSDISKLLKIVSLKSYKKKYLINKHYDKVRMFDGRTGERMEDYVNFGYIYFLKLNHLVCDKIHSRSTGPYSLVAQQPLRGKSNFGGQRFGEMEVWALEAYGASYILQEMVTIKSDDISGRKKIYENIYFSKWNIKFNVPESFKILLRELKSLYINVYFK